MNEVGFLIASSAYVAGPYSETERANLTVLASDDNAASFPHALQLHAGSSGYTSLQCGLAGADDCAVLFDRDDGLFLIRFRSSDVQAV